MATSVIMMELLGRGVHANPRRGCNVLEYASVLAGHYRGVHPRRPGLGQRTAQATIEGGPGYRAELVG